MYLIVQSSAEKACIALILELRRSLTSTLHTLLKPTQHTHTQALNVLVRLKNNSQRVLTQQELLPRHMCFA